MNHLAYDDVFWAAVALTFVVHAAATAGSGSGRRSWRRLRGTPTEEVGSAGGADGGGCVKDRSAGAGTGGGDAVEFSRFQNNYLGVYLLAVTADWLQGPYVYALYTHYGYAKGSVGQLYIAGFASSAVFGTFVASVADKYGRKNNALFYCVTYILSCATKHSGNFWMLLLGRLLGGVAYSILFSAFESWLVYEHGARRFAPELLAQTFAKAQLYNGIVAIISGKVAGYFAVRYGKVMPFDLSIGVLCLLAVIIASTWTENYGDRTQSVKGGFGAAWKALRADHKIVLLILIQSSFEGAMYTFTFIWTPALQAPHDAAHDAVVSAAATAGVTTTELASELPFGTIFASFMCATMIGSSLFSILQRHVRVEAIMRGVFAVGFLLFSATIVSTRIEVTYIAFFLFEILCGIYFPAMGTMRAPYIPEESRSALLTFSRLPLNVIVVLMLYEDFPLRKIFVMCAGLMAVALVCQHRLLNETLEKHALAADDVPHGALSLLPASSAEALTTKTP